MTILELLALPPEQRPPGFERLYDVTSMELLIDVNQAIGGGSFAAAKAHDRSQGDVIRPPVDFSRR